MVDGLERSGPRRVPPVRAGHATVPDVDSGELLTLFEEVTAAIRTALDGVDDWGPSNRVPGQYGFDVVADGAALPLLESAGVGILSEESGLHEPGRDVVVVIDPVDGSTNASLGIPWYATSLCAVDDRGPSVAVVVNQATGERFEAVRGGGARVNGAPIKPSGCLDLGDAIVGINGLSPRHLGWRQSRSLGAAALELCAVACGRLDGFFDAVRDGLGPWDYLGGLLVCQEAGAVVADAFDRPLVELDPDARRTIAAGATQPILDELVAAQATFW